ncbi:Homocysteine S-methyltransferase [Crepidotus variabilis]|uniref:Homocysteine S-methyltransferase n=1 Tax=Crepidotus variabilis TaxID=179855 RepID=A0A9P6EMJ3_9AGAR|nr:Homocysteine S-methyltransferase [Crepidotus variabilis]
MDTLIDDVRRSLVLLDGGLGTALENELGNTVSQSALWSAQPIAESPDAILEAHQAFLDSGAGVISTSTYQCSSATFERSGYNDVDARKLMRKAVALAKEAVHTHQMSRKGIRAAVALSLGPFGATLCPTQEFGGFYPPPYGPKEFVQDGENNNAFPDVADDQQAIHALANFHYDRLSVFALHKETWDAIDCIAFETIPLSREIIAIRYAIAWLFKGESVAGKPWWISCVFPEGTSPDPTQAAHRPECKVASLLEAAFGEGRVESPPVPNGFGINCTAIKHVSKLATEVLEYYQANFRDENNVPQLVLYPNGHHTFDKSIGGWKQTTDKFSWAQEFYQVLDTIMKKKRPMKLLVGGCCKVSREEIRELCQLLKI